MTLTDEEQRERDARIERLAERLGVPEGAGDLINVRLYNGKHYDIVAMVGALLDRMDQATK